jgi:hypothetical protein
VTRKGKGRWRTRRAVCPLAISQAVHTSPHRVSVVSGEKVNQNADFGNRKSQNENRRAKLESRRSEFENRQSQVANHKSPDEPMNPSPDAPWCDQEELTILLDAGRNICCLLWGAGRRILVKVDYNSWVLQEELYSPLQIARSSGGASGFVRFHVNRSHRFLIAPTVGRRVLSRAPPRESRTARFWRGARQRLVRFHHLSHEAFRRWPRAGVAGSGGKPQYTQSPEGCVTVVGKA